MTAERLFSTEPVAVSHVRQGYGAIRQAAAVIAAHDVLADSGILPGAVGGISLGALVSGCLAGAIDRPTLFNLLAHMRAMPQPQDVPAQGVAFVVAPVDTTLLHDTSEIGVHLAADLGPLGSGRQRLLILAGYLAAVEALPDVLPGHNVRVVSGFDAVHSPLQQHVADYLAPHLAAIDFRAPEIPLCSCLETKVLTSADEVRELFTRNVVEPVSVPYLRAALESVGCELGLVLGPSQFDRYLRPTFTVIHVETPEHVYDALTAVHELGVTMPPAPEAPVG